MYVNFNVQCIFLRAATPTVFTWTKPELASCAKRKSRAVERENKKAKFDESCRKSLEKTFQSDLDH